MARSGVGRAQSQPAPSSLYANNRGIMKNGNNDDQKKLTFKKVTLCTGITGGIDDISDRL